MGLRRYVDPQSPHANEPSRRAQQSATHAVCGRGASVFVFFWDSSIKGLDILLILLILLIVLILLLVLLVHLTQKVTLRKAYRTLNPRKIPMDVVKHECDFQRLGMP